MSREKSVIQRLTARDLHAQRELIVNFNPRLFMYFHMRIKGDSGIEDLVQEVFFTFFAAVKEDKIQEDRCIAPFIFGIAKRVMYNYFYKKKKDENIQKKGQECCGVSYDFEGEKRLIDEKLNKILTAQITELPEIDQTIINAFYLNNNSIGEVAREIGRSNHYVSVRKERALKKIKCEILKTNLL